MTTLPRIKLTQNSIFTILLLAVLAFAVNLFAKTRINEARALALQGCGTFAGPWRPSNSNVSLQISVSGNSAQGSYQAPNQVRRVLKGTITGSEFRGRWYDDVFEGPYKEGAFVANLIPSARLRVTFYVGNQPFDSGEWVCTAAVVVGPPPGVRPPPSPTATPWVAPTPTPEPTPTPRPTTVGSDQDTDNFETFDSLTPSEQQAVLIRRGPRLPVAYTANDLSMRVLVKSGWPLILEYGLSADNYATMSIQIADRRPRYERVFPARRDQIRLQVPRLDSDEFQVAKIRIKTVDERDNFRLYGFGMGEKAIQALRQITADLSQLTLALNNVGSASALETGLFPLLTAQIGVSVQISVSLPSSLKVKQKPEQQIEFSCTSSADFSDGRWEWWRVRGLEWEKVWQKGSGAISRNQPRSQRWNGIITQYKLASKGYHALHLVAWQKAGDDHQWVAARTDPTLEVIE